MLPGPWGIVMIRSGEVALPLTHVVKYETEEH